MLYSVQKILCPSVQYVEKKLVLLERKNFPLEILCDKLQIQFSTKSFQIKAKTLLQMFSRAQYNQFFELL